MDRQDIQNYINNFRRYLSGFLKSDVGLQTTVYPYGEGCVIVCELGINLLSKDEIRTQSKDIAEALKRTTIFEQEKGEHTQSFLGTNIILTKNKIVLIKDDNDKEWTEDKAQQDISKILSPSKEKVNG